MSLCRLPECFMAYQPVVDFDRGGILFFEALFRPGNDATPQDICIQAEQHGWIIEVDLYAISSSQSVLQSHRDISLAVNISCASIATFADAILRQLDQHLDLCSRLYLEITETRQIDLQALQAFAECCRARRIGIVQDDFGIGYSTAARARALRPSILKVVAPLATEQLPAWGRTVLQSAASLAKELKATLLVERIETGYAEVIAVSHGASAGQGYAYGKPARTVEWHAQPAAEMMRSPIAQLAGSAV